MTTDTNKAIIDIIESLPSLFYEFKDNTKSYTEEGTSQKYTMSVSPLFDKDVIDSESNKELLYLIASKVPYYYIEPSSMVADNNGKPEEYLLQDTRDCGINDVPSILQTSSFWQTWFRNTWGYLYNNLILKIYNTLQYPYVNENLFLNNNLYTQLAKKAFNNSETENSYLSFIDTEEENNAVYKEGYEFLGEEVGCLDYIQDIVSQKIESEYYLIDYTNNSALLLNKWGESLYSSGQIDTEELDSEKLLYRLQDIRNELMRRKLAGSQTVYSMILESIDRKGSYVPTIEQSEIAKASSNSSNSKRLFRVISLPGITTQFVNFNDSSKDVNYGSLLNTFNVKSEDIPINTLIPIFYSSQSAKDNQNYSSDSFYNFTLDSSISISDSSEIYRTNFLRDNLNIIDWNNLKNINLSDNVAVTYNKMDTHTTNEDGSINYSYTMDAPDSSTENGYALMDVKESVIKTITSSSSVLDISADRILYHKNSLQDSLEKDYPFVTYTVSDSNGLCLMDTYWLDYIEREIKYKSKVQDKTELGVQLSTIKQFYGSQHPIEYDFFAISYTNENYKENKKDLSEVEIRDYKEGDRYALLWYCTISYTKDIDTQKTTYFSFDKKLISVISLRNNFDNEKLSKYTDSDYNIYKKANVGVLPLTYEKAVDNVVWKNYSGFYKDTDGNYDFVDDLSDLNYNTAMFAFSNYSNLSSMNLNGNSPYISTSNAIYTNNLCTLLPSEKTRSVFYITERLNESNKEVYDFHWSDAIRVISLAKFLSEVKDNDYTSLVFNSDSSSLRYYINPYLNYNNESASPLRHSKVYKNNYEENDKKEYTIGVAQDSLLSSLITEDTWLCNNLGGNTLKSDDNVYGYYLQKTDSYIDGGNSKDFDFSYSYIQGDNRKVDEQHYIATADEKAILYSRVVDTSNIDCITITPYLISNTEEKVIPSVQKLLDIVPYKNISSSDTVNWDWKNSEDKSIFMELSFNSLPTVEYSSSINNIKKINVNTFYTDSTDGKGKLYVYNPKTNRVEEHTMYLFSYGKLSVYITSDGIISLTDGTNTIQCTDNQVNWFKAKSFGNFHVGVSILKNTEDSSYTIGLCVNEEYVELTTSVDIYEGFKGNSIPLFRNSKNEVNTIFYGNIYSIRIYNRPMYSKAQMLLTNEGAFREIYSLSPSIYKIAHTVYKDIAVTKEVVAYNGDAMVFPEINYVRVFTRGTWDSILLDREPITLTMPLENYDPTSDTDIYKEITKDGNTVYSLNNCIEQELINSDAYKEYTQQVEFSYMENSNSVEVLYRDSSNPIEINSKDKVALLNTLIEPLNYSNAPCENTVNITFDDIDKTALTQKIEIDPLSSKEVESSYIKVLKSIDSSDDAFTYSADTDFKFNLSSDMSMTRWLSKGSNIELQCITKEDKPLAVATLQDVNTFSTTKNNITLPLVIPYQENKEDFYLDRFYIKNTVLNSSLVSFLDATNYYTEVRFPIITQYNEDVYTEVGGMILTESSDVKSDSSKTYYTIRDYATSIDSFYSPINRINYIVYELKGTKADPNTDTPVTVMERGKTYYKWQNGEVVGATFSFNKGYALNSLYFTVKEDGEGNKTFIQYNEPIFNIDTTYYSSANIVTSIKGSAFVAGTTYYEDVIPSKTYYTYANGSYSLYSQGGTFSVLSSDIQLYTKSSVLRQEYVNKWDALRTLKTGTYYFTCKYPVQIMPYMDNVFNGDTDHYYATYYASSRFKVEVSTMPYLMDESEYAIAGTPYNYRAEKLLSTVQSSSNRFSPDDNCTFPHMKVNIDLYVMDIDGIAGKMKENGDEEDYSYKWVKLASNHDEETEDIISLTKDTITSTVVVSQNIPMFLEKSYTSSFFVSGRQKLSDGTVRETPDSADDDIIDPITIIADYAKRANESIKAYSEGDLDEQKLVAGKTYKVIFDYTAKIGEISFTDNHYSNLGTLENSEKVNYSRLTNILDSDFLNVQDYMYDSDGRSFNLSGALNIQNKTSGYQVVNGTSGYTWNQSTFGAIDDTSSAFAFGNPYSRASSLNYRLYNKINSSDSKIDGRSNINNSYTYPYMVTENTHGLIIPCYSETIPALKNTDTYSEINIDYAKIMANHYSEVKENIKSQISSLKSKANGLFNGFSDFKPNFTTVADKQSNISKDISIENSKYDLYGYYSENRLLPLGNSNITITRKSLYTNNLLNNSTFDNSNYWVINDSSTSANYNTIAGSDSAIGLGTAWESDTTWDNGTGKDVFKVINRVSEGKSKISLKYNGGSVGLQSIFESAINIKVITGTISSVTASYYYNGEFVKAVTLTSSSIASSNGWINYGGNTEEKISSDSVVFAIEFNEATGACYLTKAVVRKSNTQSHKLGFSDALNEANLNNKSSYVSINSHYAVMYKYPDDTNTQLHNRLYPDEYFPVQFNPTFYSTTSAGGKTVYRPKAGDYRISEFITQNKGVSTVDDNSSAVLLLNPFTRRIYVSSNGSKVSIYIHKYIMYANSLGVYEKREVYNSSYDIIDKMTDTDITIKESEDKGNFLVKFNRIPLNLSDEGEFLYYGMNLKLDEESPMTLSNERFSVLYNCFNPTAYRKGSNYSVAVTNIQLIGKNPTTKEKIIYYEYEFLPVIYSELKNHLSFNAMLYQKGIS